MKPMLFICMNRLCEQIHREAISSQLANLSPLDSARGDKLRFSLGLFNMKNGFILLTFLSLLCFAGCLISEREEYTLKINPDGKTGTLTSVKYNVQSGTGDSADEAKDFTDLINNWKSEQYLIDQVKQGTYIKDRSVKLEKGIVVWRETALIADVEKILPHYHPGDTTRFVINPEDNTISGTNGTVINMKDSTIIFWPPDTKLFTLRMKVKDFKASSKFEERFKAYLKKNHGR